MLDRPTTDIKVFSSITPDIFQNDELQIEEIMTNFINLFYEDQLTLRDIKEYVALVNSEFFTFSHHYTKYSAIPGIFKCISCKNIGRCSNFYFIINTVNYISNLYIYSYSKRIGKIISVLFNKRVSKNI